MDQGLNLIYKRVKELLIWFFSVRLLNTKSNGGMWKSSQKKKKAFLFGVLITDKDKKRND